MARTSKYGRIEETTILGLVEIARDEIEGLRDELDEAISNMEEHFSNTDRFARYQEAKDALDVCDVVDMDMPQEAGPFLETAQTFTYRAKPRASRADRLGLAIDRLYTAMEAVEGGIADAAEAVDNPEGYVDALETVRDRIQEILDGVDGVEFPGMFG